MLYNANLTFVRGFAGFGTAERAGVRCHLFPVPDVAGAVGDVRVRSTIPFVSHGLEIFFVFLARNACIGASMVEVLDGDLWNPEDEVCWANCSLRMTGPCTILREIPRPFCRGLLGKLGEFHWKENEIENTVIRARKKMEEERINLTSRQLIDCLIDWFD